MVGEGTAYEGKAGLKQEDISDGLANTIFVVEAGADKAVLWSKPEELPFDAENPILALGDLKADHFLALFGDGSVKEISRSEKPGSLRAMFTRADDDSAKP